MSHILFEQVKAEFMPLGKIPREDVHALFSKHSVRKDSMKIVSSKDKGAV